MRIGVSQLAIQISLINNFKKTSIQETILTAYFKKICKIVKTASSTENTPPIAQIETVAMTPSAPWLALHQRL